MITEQNRINAEKALAKLLGWTVSAMDVQGFPPKRGMKDCMHTAIPRWASDWSTCGPLIIEHQLIVDCDDISEAGCVEVQWRDRNGMLNPVNAYYADHPSKESAVMYAVVLAVTRKLEARKS